MDVWRCGRFALSLERPLVMGIVNVTPDSFSDGGEYAGHAAATAHGERLRAEGAGILDVGGESTRPGAAPVTSGEELERVLPVVERLSEGSVPVSVDTRRPEVAAACLAAGASVVNDVSGFRDPAMVEVVAASECGVVVMHMQGEPSSMQLAPHYDDVVVEVAGFLAGQAEVLEEAGVARERIVVDPGIGFGKTLEHNIALLRAVPRLVAMGYPVLVGASRKRFIGDISGEPDPRARVGGSIAAALFVARAGASVVRVHDVGATVQALAVDAALRG